MHRFSGDKTGTSIYVEARRASGDQWLVVAALHGCVNAVLIGVLGASWPSEDWPSLLWLYSFFIFVFLFFAALSAVAVSSPLDEAISGWPKRKRLAARLINIASICYAVAWMGMVFVVFAQGAVAQIMSVTVTSVLLGLVSARFAAALGTLIKIVLPLQMISVIAGLIYQPTLWTNFIAVDLVMALVVVLGISMYGSKEYFSLYRVKRRQARLQRLLKLQNVTLGEVSSSKSRLLAMASHDLRQPVHALGLLVDRLRCDPGSNAVRERVEVINNVVAELSTTLEKLMALAKFDAGAVPVELEPVSLDRMFVSLLHEFEPIALEKGLAFTCELDGLVVNTDATLLRTMISNLMANAIRYSFEGTVSATATLLPDGLTVRIQISDSGIGIPTERIPDIFEAFIRLGAADSGSEGLGLGLVITRRIAELLNIPIHVQSELGEGTVFSLDLPLSLSAPVSRQSFTTTTAKLKGLRVLLLDNDQIVLSSMAQTLEEWGCKTITGTSAEDIEIKLKLVSGNLDLIITDYHLGEGVTGLDVIQRIRESRRRKIPAIILTGDVAIRLSNQVDVSPMVVAHKPLSPARLSDLAIKTAALGHSL